MFIGGSIGAQSQRPLSPLPEDGLRVAPFFDGWYANADGSWTFSFGYSNLSLHDTVEIPVGPDNFIEPGEFDGGQPTVFQPAGTGGPSTGTRERERGVFSVTVPPEFSGQVVWTLRHLGETHRVVASKRSEPYQLEWPMGMGSVPPLFRFSAEGHAGRGPAGVAHGPVRVSAGQPLSVTVWLDDDSKREPLPAAIAKLRGDAPAMHVTWQKFSGPPGAVTFSPSREDIQDLRGTASTRVTFERPGDYIIRAKADNFGRLDSSAPDQCCWTNGYLKVSVEP